MLIVSIGTLSYKMHTPTPRSLKNNNRHSKFETVITHVCIDNKTSKLVCGFSKSLAVIRVNRFTMLRGVEKL